MRYRKPGRGRTQPLRAFTLAALALALLLAAGAYALLRSQGTAAPPWRPTPTCGWAPSPGPGAAQG